MFGKKKEPELMLVVRIDLKKEDNGEYIFLHTRNSMLKKEVILQALEGCIETLKKAE